MAFYENLPDWNWFDKMAGSFLRKIVVGDFYIFILYQILQQAWWMFLLIPVHVLMGRTWHHYQTGLHKIGYTNHNDNTSKKSNAIRSFYARRRLS